MKKKLPPTLRLIKKYFVKIFKDDIFGLSAEMAFYLLTAFFPFVILIFIIATGVSDQMQTLLFNLIRALPQDTEEIVMNVLLNFTGSKPIIITACFFALWSTSNVINTATKALNRFYGVPETRSYIKTRIMCLFFSFIIIAIIILCFALIIFGEGTGILLRYLSVFSFLNTEKVWNWSRYLTVISVFLLGLVSMFKVLPNKKLKFADVFVGSLLTTAAWCIASWGFSYYVNNFSRYHLIYGSIAGVIILTTWVYMSGFVILAGGVINALLLKTRKAKKIRIARKRRNSH